MERLIKQGRIIIKDRTVDPKWTGEMVRLYGEGFCACEPYWESDAVSAIVPELSDIANDPSLTILTLQEGDTLSGFLIATSVDLKRFTGLQNEVELKETTENDLYILELAVDKRYRNEGLGSRFVVEAIDEAQKAGKSGVTLRADLRNSPAIGLYQKLGFNLLTEGLGDNPFDIYIRKDLRGLGEGNRSTINTAGAKELFSKYPLNNFMFFANTEEIERWRSTTKSEENLMRLNYTKSGWTISTQEDVSYKTKSIWVLKR